MRKRSILTITVWWIRSTLGTNYLIASDPHQENELCDVAVECRMTVLLKAMKENDCLEEQYASGFPNMQEVRRKIYFSYTRENRLKPSFFNYNG